MTTFVNLVDSGAQIGAYKNQLGISKDEIKGHMQNIRFYREVAGLSSQIRELQKNKQDNIQQIDKLRVRLRLTIEEWKNV